MSSTVIKVVDEIAVAVSAVVSTLAPIAETAFPEAAAALAIGTKIVQGVLAAEPTAVALYKQIMGGTVATPAQLNDFAAAYEASYQKLNADIAAKMATTT